jgi:molybdopterin converting factor small subunit
VKIQVIYYGRLKQEAGARQQTFDLPGDGLTVAGLIATLKQQVPGLRLDAVAYAVNDEIVGPDYVLRDGDQAGLLPPVSGG